VTDLLRGCCVVP